MTPLFKKLNYKETEEIVVLNAPGSFAGELEAIRSNAPVHTNISAVAKLDFILVFVQSAVEINNIAPAIDEKLNGDGIVWFAFPKLSSKKYKTDIGRDKGWEPIRSLGFDTVRAIAIDEDWSALRFRKTNFIKNSIRR